MYLVKMKWNNETVGKCSTIANALKRIANLENEDRKNGWFKPNTYKILCKETGKTVKEIQQAETAKAQTAKTEKPKSNIKDCLNKAVQNLRDFRRKINFRNDTTKAAFSF